MRAIIRALLDATQGGLLLQPAVNVASLALTFSGLLTGFDLGRDETHLIDAGGMRDVDDLGDALEG